MILLYFNLYRLSKIRFRYRSNDISVSQFISLEHDGFATYGCGGIGKYIFYLLFCWILGCADEKVCEPPAVFIRYDCKTHYTNLGIEWVNLNWDCTLAYLYIDLNDRDQQEYKWKMQHNNIDLAKSQMDPKSIEWEEFHNTLGKRLYCFSLVPKVLYIRNFSSTSSSKNYQELIARSCSITFFLVAPTSFMQLPHMGVHGGSGKANTTVLLTIGADGTCLPPYIIYKSLRLYDKWCPKNVIPGAVFNGTESGWIDENCFYDYLSKLFIPKTGHFPRPLFLIIDNHSTHLSIKTAKLAIQHEIHILCLPPRSTHMLKPLDIYTLKYVKTQWRSLLWEFNKSSRNRALDKPDFVKLFSKLYDYALLPAHCAPSFA
ncbi:unnamed protein product [Rotaria sp. Silwood1]|nr:unnamed protein product [Rotaria sp. Silwood1]